MVLSADSQDFSQAMQVQLVQLFNMTPVAGPGLAAIEEGWQHNSLAHIQPGSSRDAPSIVLFWQLFPKLHFLIKKQPVSWFKCIKTLVQYFPNYQAYLLIEKQEHSES